MSSLVSFHFRKQESIPTFLACADTSCFERALMEMQSAYPRAGFLQTPTALIQKRDTKALLVATETLSNEIAF